VAVHTLSNVGKILLTVAGLVAVLDFLGKRLKGWTDAAEKRHELARERSDRIADGRQWQKMVTRITKVVAIHPGRHPVELDERDRDHVTTEQVEQFADEAWAEVRGSNRFSRAQLHNYGFMRATFEGMTYEFLLGHLGEAESASLAYAYGEYKQREGGWARTRLVLTGVALMAAAVLGVWLHAGGLPAWASILFAFLCAGLVVISAEALLLTPRFVTGLLLFDSAVRLRLARAGRWATRNGGRQLRLTALIVFIAGSLMDLIGGWNP